MPEVKTTRVADAYLRLKEEILSNRMPSGFQAPEPEIATLLGMSRTPVREALIKLEAEGLVELIPRRGARVLPVSLEDMAEIYEILTALEPEAAAALARRRPSKEELSGMEQATLEMEKALTANDLDAWADADDRFHRLLLELHGNKRLLAMVSVLFDQAHRARMVTLRMRAIPEDSTRVHREILEGIAAGDEAGVAELFREHRKRASSELLDILKKFRLSVL
ncbi:MULTISPECIES: GntR family transcriptional regulator [Falsihalocynthiibacter]|uniref:GntR family transcriptional regulator n=1 Tax=Falsihalocynthiibacter TaxID=2854182 RepID=UPI0005798C27|nr:GntR family transcriptional regulator [Falsihalocynthiibacter arcticus]